MSRNAILSLAIAASWGMLACQSTPEAPPPPDTGSEFSEAPVKIEEVVEEGDAIALEVIYFDFDRSDILESERANLRFNAKNIKTFRARVVVEGNTDERGSEEYNLALGERRAEAVKRYLVDLGVPAAKMRTVSFGEDRPAVQGHDESAWRYNRRVDFSGAP